MTCHFINKVIDALKWHQMSSWDVVGFYIFIYIFNCKVKKIIITNDMFSTFHY